MVAGAATTLGTVTWKIEFYEDADGRQPAREFLDKLDVAKRSSMIAALEVVLAERGLDVCASEFGKPLGEGLFEFRVRHDENVLRNRKAPASEGPKPGQPEVLLRMFCHAHGARIILLLGGYDKGEDPSKRRQTKEIERAKKRLRSFKLQQKRANAARRRGR